MTIFQTQRFHALEGQSNLQPVTVAVSRAVLIVASLGGVGVVALFARPCGAKVHPIIVGVANAGAKASVGVVVVHRTTRHRSAWEVRRVIQPDFAPVIEARQSDP